MRKIYAILTLLLLFTQSVLGVNSYPYPVRVQQPDGTYITIKIHGDETRSYKTTLDGYIVAQGKDGFFYYADYLSGELRLSATRVTASNAGYSKEIPTKKGEKRLINATKGELIDLSSLVATKAPSSIKTLVIPVQFSDVKFTTSGLKGKLFNLFNQLNYSENGATGSVKDYFRDNIGNSCNFTFDICDVVTLSESSVYYGENISGVTDKNIKMVVKHACAIADKSVDFSKYDSNRDGIADHIFIFFAGYNEAESGQDNTIWPQSWNVSDMQLYYDGVKISGFSCYSEFSGASGGSFAGIGTICHEYCHLFSLLDMYDVNGSAEGQALGLGPLSIMGTGNYNNNGKTPPYFTTIEREQMGLISVRSVSPEQSVVVEPVHSAASGLKIMAQNNLESFYIEYRDGSKWDSHIGGEGIIVYHIDKSYNLVGSMSASMRWQNNAVNAYGAHPCADPVSSLGVESSNWSDLFFPGNNDVTAIHSQYSFPLITWDKVGLGVGITDILRGATGMNMKITKDNSWNAPVITSYSIVPNQTSAEISWETDKTGPGKWNVVWGMDKSVFSDTLSISTNRITLTDLSPGEHYHCEVFYTHNSIKGKVYSMPFQTTKMVSSFPLIAEMDKEYFVGSTLRLHILNLVEDVSSIKWFVNGSQHIEEMLSFEREGEYIIKADLTYIDGSVESLEKIIKIKKINEVVEK